MPDHDAPPSIRPSGSDERRRGRLAPSPTGRLHLGHARSFLAAWWSARAAGGEIVLRIEDLDRDRCRPEYEQSACDDLAWLGMDWDGPVLRQSDDLEPYEAAVQRLLDDGRAYACTCSRAEILAARSAPHASDGEVPYAGTCRGRWADPAAAEAATGAPAGVRFRVEPGAHAFVDGLAGRYQGSPEQECGDFLLLRRDRVIAYQLSVVVDDARQGITEVVRGADLLPSTLRQLQLQRALGLPHPDWLHLPLVQDAAGRRLAKRDADRELAELRSGGLDPRRIVAWAALSLGLGEGSLEELAAGAANASDLALLLAPGFRWGPVPTEPARIDPDELQPGDPRTE